MASETTNILNRPDILQVLTSRSPANHITLIWRDNSNHEEGYEIQRKKLGSDEWVIVDTVADICYTDNGVASNMDYIYRIRAVAGEVTSDFADIRCTTAPSFPSSLLQNTSSSKLLKSGNYLHLVYVERNCPYNPNLGSIKYTRSSLQSSTWTEPVPISSCNCCFDPAIAADENGELYGVWFKHSVIGQQTYYELVFCMGIGGSKYIKTIYVQNASAFGGVLPGNCGINVDNDTVYVIWKEIYPHSDFSRVYFVRFGKNDIPTNQSIEVETVATASISLTGPSFVVNNSIPTVLYSSGDTIYLVKRTGDWGNPAHIGIGRNPVLKCDGDGLYAVWENPQTGEILYREWLSIGLAPFTSVVATYCPQYGYAYPNIARVGSLKMVFWLSEENGQWYLFRKNWKKSSPLQPFLGNAIQHIAPVAYASSEGFPQCAAYSIAIIEDTLIWPTSTSTISLQPGWALGTCKDCFVYAYVNKSDGYLAVKRVIKTRKLRGGPLSNEESGPSDECFMIAQPNPTKRILHLKYKVIEKGTVTFKIYDAAGRIVKEIQRQNQEPGVYRLKIDMGGLKAGVYFLRLATKGSNEVKTILLLR